eukprot:TRINITY_DN5968_c0_g1_i7.p1 TRINITY_DN5968_c0_g1~~TRINITY_DN5968_c0_g1_i7.p1  ORF type:complete len:102 (-),score=34.22 TRINITY_DN5968_c0_g1_i7:45-350(-)
MCIRDSSEGLALEYDGKIDVITCKPGPTLTPMVKVNLPKLTKSPIVEEPVNVVRGHLRDLGYDYISYGSFRHYLFYWANEFTAPLSYFWRKKTGKAGAPPL